MKYYTLKLWLTTISMAIIILIIATIIMSQQMDSNFGGYVIFTYLYSVLYSLPTFLIITLMHKTVLNNLDVKNTILLSSIATIFMLITIFIVFGKDKYDLSKNFSAISFSIIFMISIILSTIIIRPKIK